MNGLLDAKVESVGDKGVADAYLVAPRYLLVEIGKVLQREIVAGVEAEAAIASRLSCFHERSDGFY